MSCRGFTDPPSYLQPRQLQQAQLAWQEATPLASQFDDVYFSHNQGQAESEYVFLQQNNLPERWRNWTAVSSQTIGPQRPFVIGETGWGTGLNFLVAMESFLRWAPPTARLHYISTELYPLSLEDLRQAQAFWPQLAQLAARVQANYPLPVSGFHRLNLHPRVSLDLLLGDAATNLGAIQAQIDAWFLDGFAPAKNPSLWTPELFAALALSSHVATTFATFTAASLVRKGLQQAGFQVNKVPGFGRKREMLCGTFIGAPDVASSGLFKQPSSAAIQVAPGHAAIRKLIPQQLSLTQSQARLAIIGAGLAGLTTAAALVKRGFKVDLYEAEQAGAGGSGNKQGVLYIKLAVKANPASRFYLAALEFSQRWLTDLDPNAQVWHPCGLLQLATTPQEEQRQLKFMAQQDLPAQLVSRVAANQASQLAGTTINYNGLYFPRAGWVKPLQLCQLLAKHLAASVTFYTQQPVKSLERYAKGWQLTTAQGQAHYEQVILCAANANTSLLNQLQPAIKLPTTPVRGQVSHWPLPQAEHPALELQKVVCGNNYVTPVADAYLCFGASFKRDQLNLELTSAEHQHNLNGLTASLPQLANLLPAVENLEGRAALRCTTPDQLPLVGALPEHTGLWLNSGHGSKGLVSTPLAAEVLASYIAQEPAPLEQGLLAALAPQRWLKK